MGRRHIESEEQLLDVLTRPRPVLVDFLRTLESPLVVLGAGGKMGPTLCVLARRAAAAAGHPPEVVAVSRFSDPDVRTWLEGHGIRTLACDLLDRSALPRLPETENLIYMVGLKFGTSDHPERTWAVNTLVPARVAEHYPGARIAALSTGNVYPLVPVTGRGSTERDPMTPIGEYANSCVARERVFEFFSQHNGTPMTLIRLNYALDLHYGVLVDVARKVWAGQPIDVTMGYANAIWQGDANEMIIRSLGLAAVPPLVLNVTGPRFSLRRVAQQLGELMDRPVETVGVEAESALLSDPSLAHALLGEPPTAFEQVLDWTAHWVMRGGRLWEKPTHFEVRDGAY